MKKVILITPTGGRGEAFSLCENWYRNQSILKDILKEEWLILDDCDQTRRTLFTAGQTKVPAPVQWTEGYNTQRDNMRALLNEAEKREADYLIIFEDDDYYSPAYIETMLKLLETSEVAGISNNKYYHVGAGYRFMYNYEHSSLASTALRSSQIKRLRRAVESGQFYFDIHFWKSCKEDGVSMSLLANTNLCIGMKGLPGRAGLSRGHDKENYIEDPEHKVLKGWLGKDFEHYKRFL